MNCLSTRGSTRDRAVQSPSLACEVRVGGPLPSQVLKTQGACHRRQTGCRAASPAHLRRRGRELLWRPSRADHPTAEGIIRQRIIPTR